MNLYVPSVTCSSSITNFNGTVEPKPPKPTSTMYSISIASGSLTINIKCDIISTNWYSCTHKDAKWCTCLYTCRVVGLDRVYIYNSDYCIRKYTGELTKTKIESPTELLKLLQEEFGISLDFMIKNEKIEENEEKQKKFEEYANHFLTL